MKIEDIDPDSSETLMIWRYKAEMNIDGENFGYYYLYSNPFVVKKASDEKKPDIHKYNITVKKNSGNINKVTWDEIPGASGYSVYVKVNGKYSIYEQDASSGVLARTGKVKKSEIGKIIKADKKAIRLMIKYTINGKESKNKNSYKLK